jgi:hypothetical protein
LINPVEAARLKLPRITEVETEISVLKSETLASSRDISKYKDSNGEWIKWVLERLDKTQLLAY